MSTEPTYVVYDGECPFCSRYVRMLRLRDAVGSVELVDARADHPVVRMLRAKQVNLDEGMALVQGEHISHGDECIHRLALMTTPSDMLNKINSWIFSSAAASRILYPFLRSGRNLALRILGRKKFSW